MTNGEKIKEIFPNFHIDERSHTVWVGYEAMSFRRDWWNAEYKEPIPKNDSSGLEKNSKELEKNFGESDCISRADAIKAMQDKAKKLKNEDTINGLCGAVAILFDMPSITSQPTKNDLGVDLISRAEVMQVLQEHWLNGTVAHRIIAEIENDIQHLPSVTPQGQKTGHWIFIGEENEEETKAGNFRYVCSECGFSDVHGKSIYVPYCWQCGAKMAETEET